MLPGVLVPPPGPPISLGECKLIPVCEQDEEQQGKLHAVTLGELDVSAFKEFLQSLPSSHWEDEHASTENVKLTRPAHDAWGIKKIVFTFCDDFLQKVFDLPFSQHEQWRRFLSPIYKAAGVTDEGKIVRSLLASMPPGVNIPVHHDTGYWVKHTHRVHVAIDSSSAQVDFLVGPTPDKMQKYSFEEGRIVELNNQAKHAVSNNWDRHRVHLIFDFVEDHPINARYTLKPGDELSQTRRSIDLVGVEKRAHPLPSFVIIGAQKSGTTSMYEYISSHPLVVKSKRRETHYFDWRWNGGEGGEANHEYYLNFFMKGALDKHPSLHTGESTPSYLLHSDIVLKRMEKTIPWAKLIVMLRNPTDRAFSQYQMCIDPVGTPEQLKMRGMSSYVGKSFEEVVEEEISYLQENGVKAGMLLEDFSRIVLQPIQNVGHGGHSIVARGLYALQLKPWLDSPVFGGSGVKPTQIRVMSIGEIKGGPRAAQSTMDKVFAFVGLPPHDFASSSGGGGEAEGSARGVLEPKNTRAAAVGMSPATREKLDKFYEPFNQELFKLLGPEWRARNW